MSYRKFTCVELHCNTFNPNKPNHLIDSLNCQLDFIQLMILPSTLWYLGLSLYFSLLRQEIRELCVVCKSPAEVQGVLISPQPDQEGNKLQRQKTLIFIYPVYYHNLEEYQYCLYIYIYNKTSIKRNILTIKQNTSGNRSRNIITVYIYNKTSIKKMFSPSNKIHQEEGRAKDLSAQGC